MFGLIRNESSESDGGDAPAVELTPRQIVQALDRYIVGQGEAKRAVAIAVRNRWRRRRLASELRADVTPKNILMIGPTGVGKTEIARRLAKLTGAPFVKVEATKYTEVGYYGRDVESLVRDLVEAAITLVRERERESVAQEAQRRAQERLLDLLCPRATSPLRTSTVPRPFGDDPSASISASAPPAESTEDAYQRTRKKFADMLQAGELEHRRVELTIESKAKPMMLAPPGMENLDVDLQGMFDKLLPRSTSRREMTVAEARKVLVDQESEALLDNEKVNAKAIDLAENLGIVFLDEIDKIVASEGKGADVSRQGVQRDLLPIVEGTTVQTRYGHVRTDHVLFIAAGAFHRSQPSDLMPELQGRFPIRVELRDLAREDFIRILKEPRNSLIRQYEALLATEGVELSFTDEAIEAMAHYAWQVNQSTQNIGARRLSTLLERLLEELSFEASEIAMGKVVIDAAYVNQRLEPIARDEDLSRYIL